jgi:hypothetical protein
MNYGAQANKVQCSNDQFSNYIGLRIGLSVWRLNQIHLSKQPAHFNSSS